MLDDPARLAALRQCARWDGPAEEPFDRLTRLVTKVLHVPVSLVSFVAGDHQFFKSCVGLPEPWASARRTPLTHSFCQHVVRSGRPFVVPDATADPLVRDNRAIAELNVIAYAGVPLVTPAGHALGSLCAIDVRPRAWTDEEVGILYDIAACVMAEVELVAAREERGRLVARLERERRRVQRVLGRFRSACSPPAPGTTDPP